MEGSITIKSWFNLEQQSDKFCYVSLHIVSSNKGKKVLASNALAFEARTQSSIFFLAIKKKQTSIANLIPNHA